jgi:hypothetical protein
LSPARSGRQVDTDNCEGGTGVADAARAYRLPSSKQQRARKGRHGTVPLIEPAFEEATMSDEAPKIPKAPKLTLTAEVGLGHYSNFVSIAHNFSEVLLDFGRTLPGREDIPVVARIIMNPFQAKQLLRALSHNVQMYESSFGPVPDPPATADSSEPSTTH